METITERANNANKLNVRNVSSFEVNDTEGNPAMLSLENLKQILYHDDNPTLNELAFYIDVNEPSPKGAEYVNVGGNMNMRQLWEDSKFSCLMDANGDYCILNPNDCRYTEDGEYILTGDGKLAAGWDHLDMMVVIPKTYGKVQLVQVGGKVIERLWLSLVPLPGGYEIPMLVVGKFKASLVGGVLRSVPGYPVTASQNIRGFWDLAQKRSKSHGLANHHFRWFLLNYMMSKYGQRSSQTCKGSDGTPIWGVGLDGSESAGDGFSNQSVIKPGATLSLGDKDGKSSVLDNSGTTVHCVNVAGFQDPWGQYWEMVQGLCSVANDVYCWNDNFVPSVSTNPTAGTFEHINHVVITRSSSDSVCGINIISTQKGQGIYYVPKKYVSGISYGDNYWYSAGGQLWLFGGYSASGVNCGLTTAYSSGAWSDSGSSSNFSARLAFYGSINRKSSREMKK